MSSFDSIRIYATVIFVALSGIYWLPGISSEIFSVSKLVAFTALVLLGFFAARPISQKELNLRITLALAGVFAFAAATWSSDFNTAFSAGRNYIEPVLWIVALSATPPQHRSKLLSLLTLAMLGLVTISLYPLLAQAGVLPDFNTPTSYFLGVDNEWLVTSSRVSNSGFSGARTGWGVTVATGGLLAAVLLLRARKNLLARWGAVIILALSGLSIAVTGARGGIVALFVATAFLILSARGRFLSSAILVSAILVTAVATDIRELVPANLLRGFETGGTLFERLDSMTTNRFSTYSQGVELIEESPLVGVGPERARIAITASETSVQVHNLWLRVAVETGIIPLFFLVLATFQLLGLALSRRAGQTGGPQGSEWPNARPVIICGLVLALAEPNVVIGSFNANAAFWTSVWIVLNEPRTFTARGVKPSATVQRQPSR